MIGLVNCELLAAVEVLSDENSYYQAAQRLGITTTLLRRKIAALEEQLEFRVFEMHGKQVKVTPEGQAFINSGRAFLNEVKIIKALRQEK